ncbi:hypothetical protein D9611_010430 [Ephemerocybe angulata]|uniref:DUF1996 domain-containing protein n=1 Tax=Ephemerocybe angulata TaxID=980116 RepID=A0A8H5BUZ4_9AGAR|nr:hypothetical protein D9611_010430 [Tulosesus angulatus]
MVVVSSFDIQMSADSPMQSTCTTCRWKEDASNYWTSVLYFKHQNGSYLRVPQVPPNYTGSPNGGIGLFYIRPPEGNQKVTAFPKGFRMIVGDPSLRNKTFVDPNSSLGRALTFRCWDETYNGDPNLPAPGTGSDTIELPKKLCAGGIRSNIYFPSCWNGKDLDPPDHSSHMAYPNGELDSGGHFWFSGECPASHPIRVPRILMEVSWDTRQFNNMWPSKTNQPFVFSQGDPTGYGQHADYIFGWKGDSLQRAMDNCWGYPNCQELTDQSSEVQNSCTQKSRVDEVVEGKYINALPGCNLIQAGPSPATMDLNPAPISLDLA